MGTARRLVRIGIAVGVIALATAACAGLLRLNPAAAGLVYLVATVAIATTLGLWEAVAASLAATLCYNYFFFPPLYTPRVPGEPTSRRT